MDSTNEVDWRAISEDPIRAEHEIPWLDGMIDEATENGLHEVVPGVAYWRGYREALLRVRNGPDEEILAAAAAEVERQRKKEIFDGERVPVGAGWLRRLPIGGRKWWRRDNPDRDTAASGT